MFNKILIANRGEIACRVIRTAKKMGIKTVAVYSDADQNALHVQESDEAVNIGSAPAAESYLSIDKILDAVQKSQSEAVHPGYGFLSENKDFAQTLSRNSVEFIGPPASAIEAMGDKIESKRIASSAGVSIVPGFDSVIESEDMAVEVANNLGFPLMIKASAGGGGKGMRIAWNTSQVIEGFKSSRNEAASAFGDDRIFIERFITGPRHIEIQILADKHGNCIFLNERECSIQRRNQKVIEEAPSPFLDEKTRQAMGQQAVQLAQSVDYYSAGTVEFIVDSNRNFYFLEMNTRLQVEHPITELITGVDLVEQMFRIANGEKLNISQADVGISGWAVESRIYAEDPNRGFLPSVGRLTTYFPPKEKSSITEVVRNDSGVYEGGEISVHYDPMISKLCSWGTSRNEAIELMRTSLDEFLIDGISSNIPFLSTVMDHPKFINGEATTAFIEEEFGEGFSCQELSTEIVCSLVAGAATIYQTFEIRNSKVSGVLPNHERRVEDCYVVSFLDEMHSVSLSSEDGKTRVEFEGGNSVLVSFSWIKPVSLAAIFVQDKRLIVRVDRVTNGLRIRYRGSDVTMLMLTQIQSKLMPYMPVNKEANSDSQLLCPMPGLIVSVDVAKGDTVEIGQKLCTMEAMKMENVLKAEIKAVVKSVKVKPGDILGVDDIILEFD